MKKLFYIAVALVILVIAIAGCSGTDTANSTDVNDASAPAAPDNSDRILQLATEGQNIASDASDESNQAAQAATSGDLYGACSYVPDLRSKANRLADITSELDSLGADTSNLHPALATMQSGLAEVESACG